MAQDHEILRYAAFSRDPAAGNPAGVVPDASGLDAEQMQRIAAEVGFSETAFLVPDAADPRHLTVRYFSPLAEVPFCGHATIASAVALAERTGPGRLTLDTPAGEVVVSSRYDGDGALVAALTSVAPRVEPLAAADLDEILAALRWEAGDLDPALPGRVAFAGAWHPVVAAASRDRLAVLDYDFDRLGRLMAHRDWTTVALVWREHAGRFHVRNPFPPGGVVEDPATGAAAAAFGAYLRALALVDVPSTVSLRQGDDLGRPSRLTVDIPAGDGPITVSGHAVAIPRDGGVDREAFAGPSGLHGG
jgi:PhzF family phenazine biosynthesis protein